MKKSELMTLKQIVDSFTLPVCVGIDGYLPITILEANGDRVFVEDYDGLRMWISLSANSSQNFRLIIEK